MLQTRGTEMIKDEMDILKEINKIIIDKEDKTGELLYDLHCFVIQCYVHKGYFKIH